VLDCISVCKSTKTGCIVEVKYLTGQYCTVGMMVNGGHISTKNQPKITFMNHSQPLDGNGQA